MQKNNYPSLSHYQCFTELYRLLVKKETCDVVALCISQMNWRTCQDMAELSHTLRKVIEVHHLSQGMLPDSRKALFSPLTHNHNTGPRG